MSSDKITLTLRTVRRVMLVLGILEEKW